MDQIDMTHRRWPFLTIGGPLTNRRALRVLRKARWIPPPGPCVHSGQVAAFLERALCGFAASRLGVTVRLGSAGMGG